MASDRDDERARQLETLRRYMARFDTEWEPPTQLGLVPERHGIDLAGPARRRRPTLPWLLAGGLLVVLALIGGMVLGAVAWSDDRPAGKATGGSGQAAAGRDQGGAAAAAVVATPACKTAVDRANAMLASAVRLRQALAEQGRVLKDPANRGLPVGRVRQKLAASERVGSAESARFDRALDAYRQVVDQCDLQVP
jgi:hypothetical protein